MRLTAELVEHATQRMNPLKEREILLRGYKIDQIENTGTLRDAYDCIDLSENEIMRLGNFARSHRLTMLLLNNNKINTIEPRLGEDLLNLECLILTGNRIQSFAQLDALASCKKLQVLALLDNPIARSPHYRPYMIAKGPSSLKLLDYRKIKPIERTQALQLFPPDSAPLVDLSQPPPPPPPSKPVTSHDSNGSNFLSNLTQSQKDAIKQAIAAATTPEEIDTLEKQIRSGIFPPRHQQDVVSPDKVEQEAMAPRPPRGPPPFRPPPHQPVSAPQPR